MCLYTYLHYINKKNITFHLMYSTFKSLDITVLLNEPQTTVV